MTDYTELHYGIDIPFRYDIYYVVGGLISKGCDIPSIIPHSLIIGIVCAFGDYIVNLGRIGVAHNGYVGKA